MRKIYRVVVIQQLFWGLVAWFSPTTKLPVERSHIIRGFIRIRKRAALMISGALKSLSAAKFDIELFLTLINLLMQQTVEETAIQTHYNIELDAILADGVIQRIFTGGSGYARTRGCIRGRSDEHGLDEATP
ncbi:hypothetical protein N7448_008943 [Penicillium atrosanguineum]|nr:hypothetical protein N7448_008943 [Penicillium atrosanguineum]